MSKYRIYNSFLILFITIFLTNCASNSQNSINTTKQNKIDNHKKINECKPEVIIKIKEIIKETPPKIIIKECTHSKVVVGQIEYVYIPSIKKTFKARIDTGATTTSIHALNIKEFERDGQKWVNFDFINKKEKLSMQLPIYKIINVKRHETKNQKRYVVKMRMNLSESSQVINVSLTNRSNFTFPVLIGRNFLNGIAIVDVSKRYTAKPTRSEY